MTKDINQKTSDSKLTLSNYIKKPQTVYGNVKIAKEYAERLRLKKDVAAIHYRFNTSDMACLVWRYCFSTNNKVWDA